MIALGFIIKYNPFFSVTVYEKDSNNPFESFSFFPTIECRRLLNNFNLVFRPRSSGFEVFYGETPLIPITEKNRFSFGLTFSDFGLFEKYGLTKTGESDTAVYQPGFYFDNLKSNGSIVTANPASMVAAGTASNKTVSAEDTYRLRRQTFHVYDAAGDSAPSGYELSHMFNPSLTQTIPVKPNPGMAYLATTINSIDMEEDYLGQPGPYLLKANKQPPPVRNLYLSDELGRGEAQGAIDIYWGKPQNNVSNPGQGQRYTITFKPK